MGLPDSVRQLADEHRGLILVTGPTGSGKTTTLAAMIGYINETKPVHIVTIEDPIEVLHRDAVASINQREIGNDTQDFLSALRAALRQDPDVILIGEMRDTETVRAAIQAAETGHLVLSTLHTVDATETVNRVIDFFPPYQQKQVRLALAGTLRGIICQRLVSTVDGGRTPALEILVNTGRVAERIVDPERTSEIKEVLTDGALLRDDDVRSVALDPPPGGEDHDRGRLPGRVEPARLRARDAAGGTRPARLIPQAVRVASLRGPRQAERDPGAERQRRRHRRRRATLPGVPRSWSRRASRSGGLERSNGSTVMLATAARSLPVADDDRAGHARVVLAREGVDARRRRTSR